MKQIRRGVFETNSSSSHSVSINSRGELKKSYLIVDSYDNKVHVPLGEFGWEIETYDSQLDKLSYLCTMAVETYQGFPSVEDFFESNNFKIINEAIANYCNCDGIHIDTKLKVDSYTYDKKTTYYLEHDGYIDHQSCEDYGSLQDFLDDYNTDVINFIFNSGVLVHTDNDNH